MSNDTENNTINSSSVINTENLENDTSNQILENKIEDRVNTSKKKVIDFQKEQERLSKNKKLSPLKIVLSVFIFITLVIVLFSAWNRWFRYDDAGDLVSNWQISQSNAKINIDKYKMYLDKNTIFEYQIDTVSKVITFKTGNYEGQCHYRFNFDRTQVAFIEDGNYNFVTTMFSDFKWFFDYVISIIQDKEISVSYSQIANTNENKNDSSSGNILDNSSSILLDKIATKKT